ncbi:MAG: rod shape-determining protein MreD [Desulfomonilaceae bacterium]
MKAYLFGLLMTAIALFFQTTTQMFLSHPIVKPDIVLIIVIWASTRFGFNEGILFSFSAGLLADCLSGAPTGLFAFLYCVSFLVCRYLDATTDLDTHGARFVAAFAVCILEAISVLASRYMAGPFGMGAALALSVFAKALFTGSLAIVVMPLLDRLWIERPRLSGLHR